jgi:hypothetical protein
MKAAIPRSLLMLVCILIVSAAQAQLKGFSIGPYVEGVWPTGGFENTHKRGIGAGVGADLKLPARLGLSASMGYLHIPGKQVFHSFVFHILIKGHQAVNNAFGRQLNHAVGHGLQKVWSCEVSNTMPGKGLQPSLKL